MLFNIWSPATIAPDEITFDVTRANIPRVGSGDAEWIAACLAALGVSAPARGWTIEAARCQFYSDYADETEWEDRWPATWVVNVRLDGAAPGGFGPPESIPKQIDQYDRTWQRGQPEKDHDRNAMLLMLLKGSVENGERMLQEVLGFVPADLRPGAKTRVDDLGGGWIRLRIGLTGALFPERAETLDEVLRQCRQRNMTVNRNDLPE